MRWQIVNYLIENSDGHGKNLALRYSRGQVVPTLAPFYDIIAIGYLNQLCNSPYSRRMAFYIGGEREISRITRSNWEGMARDLGMRPARVIEELITLVQGLPSIVRNTRTALEDTTGSSSEHHEQIERTAATRCAWVLRNLDENVKTRDPLN